MEWTTPKRRNKSHEEKEVDKMQQWRTRIYFREQKEEKKMQTRQRTVNSEQLDNELGFIF